MTEVREGLIGDDLTITELIWPGRVISEYRSTLMTLWRAAEVVRRLAFAGPHEEYQLSVDVADVVIDGMDASSDTKYANHSYKPNARYFSIWFCGSYFDVVSIPAIKISPPGDEILVDY